MGQSAKTKNARRARGSPRIINSFVMSMRAEASKCPRTRGQVLHSFVRTTEGFPTIVQISDVCGRSKHCAESLLWFALTSGQSLMPAALKRYSNSESL